jgi:hypothetical protein
VSSSDGRSLRASSSEAVVRSTIWKLDFSSTYRKSHGLQGTGWRTDQRTSASLLVPFGLLLGFPLAGELQHQISHQRARALPEALLLINSRNQI